MKLLLCDTIYIKWLEEKSNITDQYYQNLLGQDNILIFHLFQSLTFN